MATNKLTRAPLKIQEEDGSPNGFPVVLKVSNGKLTDNSDGSFSLNVLGVTDHGGLSGLLDDDHTQYSLNTPTFVTLSTDARLTNERVLTGTTNQIIVTDNGAGSTAVLSLPQNIHTTATPTFGTLTLNQSTGTLLTVGGGANADRSTTFDFNGSQTIRLDDNADTTGLILQNRAVAATTDQGIGMRFELADNAGTVVQSGAIRVRMEQDMTATLATRDTYMAFFTTLDGVIGEKMRLTSAGSLNLGSGGFLVSSTGVVSAGTWAGTSISTTYTDAKVTSIVAGTAISISGATGAVTINNTGVTSATGTANQVTVSASTGAVTFSLPQNIHTAAAPTFADLTLSKASGSNPEIFLTSGLNSWRIFHRASSNNQLQFLYNGAAKFDLDTSGNLSSLTSVTATTLTGTISTAAQPNITSLGTLTGLTISGTGTGARLVLTAVSSAGTELPGVIINQDATFKGGLFFDESTGSIDIYSSNNGSGTTPTIRVKGGAAGLGNVGIGVTNPSTSRLMVEHLDNANFVASIVNATASGTCPGLLVLTGQNGGAGAKFEVGEGTTVGSYSRRFTVTNDGNVGIWTNTFGTSGRGVFGIANGTEPTTSPADMVQLYSVDLSAGNATLGLRTETAVVTESVTSDRTLSVKINGTVYKLLLKV